MDIVDEPTIESLVTWEEAPCVSIFMPTHRMGRETEADPILFKNLLDRAHGELVAQGMRSPDAADLLAAGRRLLTDAMFWQHQEDGLAYFTAPKHTSVFRLPAAFHPIVVTGQAFHVKPLWPLVTRGELFDVLTLSRNRIRLLWATRYRVGEIDLPEEIPESLAEALWFEDLEKQLQLHGGPRIGRGRVVATFHGRGTPDEHDEERLVRFFRAVDTGIAHLMEADRPLVLAGVEEMVAMYRKTSRHPTVLHPAIIGNVDRMSPQDLHGRAWAIAAPHFAQVVGQDEAAYLAGGELSASGIEAALTAAMQGRVAAIFVPSSTEVWGTVDVHGTVSVSDDRRNGDRDLLDLAAVAVWRHGGRVHVVPADEVPGTGPLAARLRY